MTIPRTLTGLTLAAAIISLAPTAAQAASGTTATGAAAVRPWGPYYASGNSAKALGSLTATGEDHADIPAARTVNISGKVYDQTRATASCGWAVFRITYRDASNNLPFKHHSVRTCAYRTAKPFSFSYGNVYQVELKVCSEGKAAKPSLNCLYAGTWKLLYLSK
ncbi:hypothetical protein [Sphaerisporangium fuscum]|uniref:hypothetical protein n=1 Tax=Sphaerisporangium fuscum TaxID=2835868 RepID=UPI001BDC5077|nr:hypothetical protein [Sphaerisporangium fuscum]